MKNYKKIAAATAVCILSLKGAAPAYAADLTGAIKLAKSATDGTHTYSQNSAERTCTSSDNTADAQKTGYCKEYDCSSLVTWVLRQIPGQSAVPLAPTEAQNTFTMYDASGSENAGPPDPSKAFAGTNRGWGPCNPASAPVCVGFTHWGEEYPEGSGKSAAGPGHVIISLEGTVYEAAGSGLSAHGIPAEGSGFSQVVWVTPPIH